jgi:AraC-like DNA-binding protein
MAWVAQETAHMSESRSAWTSLAVRPAWRFDAWAEVLDESFLPWTLNDNSRGDFYASVRQRRFGGCRLLSCTCDPIGGQRSVGNIARTAEHFLSVLYVQAGLEMIRIEGRDIVLKPGDMVLWDSERKMEFSVGERLQKLTLMVPEAQVRAAMPQAMDLVGVPVDSRRGAGALFVNHLETLEREIWTMSDAELAGLMPATLELLASAYQRVVPADGAKVKSILLQRVRRYILEHLNEPGLTPASIAGANRMSVRYLHLLFEDSGTTVAGWIRFQRIEHSKRELMNPSSRHRSITEIAYDWGFSDAAHFSKVFRKQVGIAPSEFRNGTKRREAL